LLLVTGFLGAYTTFSTFSYETIVLLLQGSYSSALYNIVTSVVAGLVATFGGILLGRWLA